MFIRLSVYRAKPAVIAEITKIKPAMFALELPAHILGIPLRNTDHVVFTQEAKECERGKKEKQPPSL